MAFGWSGLIRGVTFGWSGLIRGVAFGWISLIRGRLLDQMKDQKMSHNNKYTHDFGKAIQITKHSYQSSELEFEMDETI